MVQHMKKKMNHHVLDVEKKRFGVSISLRFFSLFTSSCFSAKKHSTISPSQKKKTSEKKKRDNESSQL